MPSEHTPGPWRAEGPNVYAKKKLLTCVAGGEGISIAEDDANARLIAAAPDLLWHCEVALEFMENINKGLKDGDERINLDPLLAAIA